MIDLEQVRTFVAIIEVGSFRRAARALGIAQPTASQHIKKLEATLARPLLERNRIRTGTTPDGARFLPYARTLLKTAERAQIAVGGGLAVGASGNIGVYLLQPLVRAFNLADPQVAPIDIRIGTNLETAKRLEEAEIDIALMEWWDARPGFDAYPWREERFVVIVPPDHPLAPLETVDAGPLLGEPILRGESGTGTTRLLHQALGAAAAEAKIGLRLGSTEAVKQGVRAGLGISIVFASAVRDEVNAGTLRALEIRNAPLSKPLFAILPSGLPEGSAAAKFARFLRADARVFS